MLSLLRKPITKMSALPVLLLLFLAGWLRAGPAITPCYNYPPMLLQVPFLCQLPAGGDWKTTKNCGQTCSAMLNGYFRNVTPVFSDVTKENTWLSKRFKDGRYLNVGGYYTSFNGQNSLGVLLKEYYSLNTSVKNGRDITAVLDELKAGRPVIVGVRIDNGLLVTSGGSDHWALAVGWNARDSMIILNDPGKTAGRQYQYSVGAFEKSWATQGRIYASVSR